MTDQQPQARTSCPWCGSVLNSEEYGGTAYCFHCADCDYVQCEQEGTE